MADRLYDASVLASLLSRGEGFVFDLFARRIFNDGFNVRSFFSCKLLRRSRISQEIRRVINLFLYYGKLFDLRFISVNTISYAKNSSFLTYGKLRDAGT